MQEIEKKEDIKKKTEKIRKLEYWISEKFMEIILFTEKQVMLTLKEEFSKLFSKWFSILVSESLSAKLDDDFSPVVEQQDYELDYAFLSGGERTAIALAYRLSLNQVINSLLSHIKTRNLVILDEPTEGFSTQQLDKMREVLSQLNVEQLILVSHEQKIEGFVDNIIRLTKDAGITKIE
jgi:exonuclease SbcC